MKKVLVVLAMFSLVVLTSCTDNTEENLVEKERRNELIDKDKVETPTTKG
ncbi:hypothetical protein [Tenacibaculum ovolyticum]|nr:hypothetical protein [Tenacibaculum ovolyticum]